MMFTVTLKEFIFWLVFLPINYLLLSSGKAEGIIIPIVMEKRLYKRLFKC